MDNTTFESRDGYSKQDSLASTTSQAFRPSGRAPNTAGGIGLHSYVGAKAIGSKYNRLGGSNYGAGG